MSTSTEAPEPRYLALLGFAEHFRTSSPPKIRLCVHCLQAVFQFEPPPRVEARTHLQLGSVLYRHTKNSELAQTHLEKAVCDTFSKSGVATRKSALGMMLTLIFCLLLSIRSGLYRNKYPFCLCYNVRLRYKVCRLSMSASLPSCMR